MDVHQLKHFLQLAEMLNFRRTAETTYIAQPALSRQIQQLEDEIGALLFRRDKRNVSLTPAGLYYREEVNRLLHQLDFAGRRAAQIHRGEAGEVRIGHASSAMQSVLPRLLVQLRQRTPNLRPLLMETTNRHQLEALLNREIEIGFAPNVVLPHGIASRVVYEEPFVLLLPENHRINQENFIDLSALANDDFILPPRAEGHGYIETIDALCQHYGFRPRITHESAYSATVLRLVEAGIGVSVEPRSTVQGQQLRLTAIELTNAPRRAEMMLVWLKAREDELRPLLTLLADLIKV
jgi:DNA-binding transcriptional LysR family regulator